MKANGQCKRWLARLDEKVRKIVEGVNGPLLATLLHVTGYADKECLQLLEQGVNFHSMHK